MPTATKKKVETEEICTDLLIGFCLDRSPSMSGLTASTIKGVNDFLDSHRAEKGDTWLSLCLFDGQFDIRYVATSLKDVAPMSGIEGPNIYRCGGNGTALYDAVDVTIEGIQAWHNAHPEFGGKTLIVILTDGQENMSRKWAGQHGLDHVNGLIADKTALGWDFVFMGAGQSAWLEAKQFTSIPAAQTMVYAASPEGTISSTAGLVGSTVSYRSASKHYAGATLNNSITDWQVANDNAGLGIGVDKTSKPEHKGRVTKKK